MAISKKTPVNQGGPVGASKSLGWKKWWDNIFEKQQWKRGGRMRRR